MSAPFKVGDRVTALAGGPTRYDETAASVPRPISVGKTGVVVGICESGLNVQFPDGIRDYARFHYWAKADSAPAFTPGDVVTLKSGGPKMTVTDVNSGTVETVWFSGYGCNFDGVFPVEALCRK